MTIGESFKEKIKSAFIHTTIRERSYDCVLKTIKGTAYGSDTFSILPPIQGFKMEKIDDTHDKLIFRYDDYTFEVFVSWKLYPNGNAVFENIY